MKKIMIAKMGAGKGSREGGHSLGMFLTEPFDVLGWSAGDMITVEVPDEDVVILRKKEPVSSNIQKLKSKPSEKQSQEFS